MFVEPLYIPRFNEMYDPGAGTGNIWHNPTSIMVKPFAIFIFCVIAKIVEDNRKIKLQEIMVLVVSLFLSRLAKPSFLLYFSYQLVAGRKQIEEVEGWVCVLWAYIVIEYISRIPLISNLLKEIGKYSGNIFLIHTYIYLYFYSDFIYSFKKDYLIFAVLLTLSMLISFVLETVKKLMHYNTCVDKILIKTEALFERRVR